MKADQPTPSVLSEVCSHFPDTSSFLSFCLIPKSSLFLCLLIFVCFPLSPPQLPLLSLIKSFTRTVSYFILPYSFQPLFAASLFHSLRKSHSLIWDMLDLVSLKATLLTPCVPLLRRAQAILNSFTVCQALSAGMLLIWATFHSVSPVNANPLPESPPSPFSFSPLLFPSD